MPQAQSEGQTDFRELADPEFLAERTRVREALESTPQQSPRRAGLAAHYQALSAEFDRRASQAWTAGS